jgi:hypothetical protein
MKPENKNCPFCGGQLKECRKPLVVHNGLIHLTRGGLTINSVPFFSIRCGYQCNDCGIKISTEQFSKLEVCLQDDVCS